MAPLMQLRLPVIVFTDGFRDVNPGGKDGVWRVDGATSTFEAFGQDLPQEVAQELRKTAGTTQIVGQTELLIVVAAKEFRRSQRPLKEAGDW